MSKKLFTLISLFYSLNSFGTNLDSLNQGFYVKISSSYHTPLSNQNSPMYFQVPFNNSSSLFFPMSNKEFSLAKGLSYEFKIGKVFSNNVGFEIGLNSLNSHHEYGETANYVFINNSYIRTTVPLITSDFSSLYLKPTIVLGKKLGKSSVLMKVGVIVASSKLSQTYAKLVTYNMKTNINLGYFMGIDYALKLSKRIGFSCEIGIDNLFYIPQQATLDNPALYFNYISSITYVDKYSSQIPLIMESNSRTNNSSSILLTQTLKLSSLYFGFGLNYNFIKNEKK